MSVRAVISMLEDVVYPASLYRTGACRAGARLLRTLFRVDLQEALEAYYVPGAEELAVRAALEERFNDIDARLVEKTAAVMAAHAPHVAPYSDALEVFSILQAMNCPLGLLADGPPGAQRLLARHLNVNRIFQHILYISDLTGEEPWLDGLHLMEMLVDCPLTDTALICTQPAHARLAAGRVGRIFRLARSDNSDPPTTTAEQFNGIPMANLYDLPEALSLVAWPE